MEKLFLRLNSTFLLVLLVVLPAVLMVAQTATVTKPETAKKDDKKPIPTPNAKNALKPETAEQVTELAIFIYGLGSGRAILNQIRKTTIERGKTIVTGADGKVDQASYQRFIVRAETLNKEKIRLDQEFPGARYSLVFADEKIYGIYNNSVFTPREDASKAFENQIVHGLEALLRYKENESRLELGPREKLMAVDFYVVDVTDKQDRKTRFYISARQFRVMMLTYEDGGVKYRRKFYDYNYAQGTLVPYHSVLWANDKIIEESDVLTVTFGQKVDEELFKAS